MRRQFKDTICELAEHDERIVIVFGDISVFLFKDFWDRHPERFFNLGICENTIISVCAGLASQGLIPFAHSITPFVTERCLEQLKLDWCYNGFGGNLVSCGASFDYAWDGPSHHAYGELAALRMLPGMEVVQPGSKRETDALLRSQYASGNPTYYRLSDHSHPTEFPIEFGKGVVLLDRGAELTVMTAGPLLANVLPACQDREVNLVYFHTLKPIDRALIERFRGGRILVVHDAHGLQEAIHEVPGVRTWYHGLRDSFVATYGTVPEIRAQLELDVAGIGRAIERVLAE